MEESFVNQNLSEGKMTPEPFVLAFFRVPVSMVAVYSVFYGTLFVVGLLGNVFVVLAVASHQQLRSTTDYLISSLAMADLLIIVFCLPTTLLNNILIEWHLGRIFCKMSTWINSTTSCASIYTLVVVTADRYLAICHTLKYTLWETKYTLYVIAGIWLVSGTLAIPNFYSMNEVVIKYERVNLNVCIASTDEKLHFVIVNLCLGFLVPFLLISVSYTRIFITVSNHRSLAVDAHIRDERVKLRVATMMLTVIVLFALCWLPLYGLYVYFVLLSSDHSTEIFIIASDVLRPIFQWLSLLSSTLNPLIYIAYSHKYRRAFHRILLLPCKSRYERVRGTLMRNTENTSLRLSITETKKGSRRIISRSSRCVDLSPMPSSLAEGGSISPIATLIDSPRGDRQRAIAC